MIPHNNRNDSFIVGGNKKRITCPLTQIEWVREGGERWLGRGKGFCFVS